MPTTLPAVARSAAPATARPGPKPTSRTRSSGRMLSSCRVRTLRRRLDGRTRMMNPTSTPSSPLGFPNCWTIALRAVFMISSSDGVRHSVVSRDPFDRRQLEVTPQYSRLGLVRAPEQAGSITPDLTSISERVVPALQGQRSKVVPETDNHVAILQLDKHGV